MSGEKVRLSTTFDHLTRRMDRWTSKYFKYGACEVRLSTTFAHLTRRIDRWTSKYFKYGA